MVKAKKFMVGMIAVIAMYVAGGVVVALLSSYYKPSLMSEGVEEVKEAPKVLAAKVEENIKKVETAVAPPVKQPVAATTDKQTVSTPVVVKKVMQSLEPENKKQVPTKTSAKPSSKDLPIFDIAKVDVNGGVVIAGRAEPGWQIFLDTEDKRLAEIRAEKSGEWVYASNGKLQNGSHISLSMSDPDSLQKVSSEYWLAVDKDASGMQKLRMKLRKAGDVKRVERKVIAKPEPQQPVVAATKPVEASKPQKVVMPEQPKVAKPVVKPVPVPQKVANEKSGMKKPEPKPETGKSEPSMLSRMVSTLTGSSAKKKDEPKTAGAVVEKKATKDKATTGAASTPKATKERPKYVIVKPGDTLVTIARKYYGDGRHYKKIHEANKLKLKRGVWWIWPGQRLILP